MIFAPGAVFEFYRAFTAIGKRHPNIMIKHMMSAAVRPVYFMIFFLVFILNHRPVFAEAIRNKDLHSNSLGSISVMVYFNYYIIPCFSLFCNMILRDSGQKNALFLAVLSRFQNRA